MNVKYGKIFGIALFIFALMAIGFWIIKPVSVADISVADVIEDNFNFRWILPPRYYQGSTFYRGRAWVQERKNGPWTLFDTDGNVIVENFIAKDIWHRRGSDTTFTALERDSETGWEMYGFIDDSGNIIVEPKPHWMPPFYQSGISDKRGENGLLGIIDFQENWVIPPIYEDTFLWADGLMAARKDGKWGFINKSGDIVIDFRFERVHIFRNGLSVATQNSLFGLIDRNGDWVTDAIYERFFYPWSELVGAQKDGKIGFLDARGNVVIDFKFIGMEGTGIQHGRGAFLMDAQ